MAITEALRLLISADTAGAVRGIEQVGRTADRNLSRSEQQIERWGHRLTSVGSGLVAFGAVAAYGLGQAAQSAGELEQAVGGSEAVFKEASATIDAYAANAADKVGLSERAYRESTTLIGTHLKRLGFDVDAAAEQSNDLVEIGADLAAQYGGTTAEAVEALGAAFRGEADPAERFGLDLRASAVAAEAVALGLAESTSAVDDHARAQALLSLITKQSADAMGANAREADTLQGRQQRLSAEFENLKASIGEGVLPVMETLFNAASKGVETFSGLNDATGGLLGQVATITTVGALATGGLSLLVGQALKMHQTFTTAKDAVVGLSGKMGGLKGAAAGAAGAAGIAGLAVAAVQLGDALDKALTPTHTADLNKLENALLDLGRSGATSGELADVAGDDFGKLADAIRRVADPSTASRARDVLTTVLTAGSDNDDLEQARQDIDDVDKALARLAQRDPAEAAAVFDALTAALGEQGVSAGTVKDLLDDYDSTLADIDTAAAVSGTDDLGGAMDAAAGSTGEATSSLEEYSDALKSLFDPLFGAISAQNGLRDANQDVAAKTAALAEAQAQYGAGSAEAAEAAQALSDAQTEAAEAALDQESSLLALKDAVDAGTVSVGDAKAKLAEWVAQGWITQASADATAAALDGVTWSAGAIPSGRSIDIGVTGTQYVLGQLDAIARRVNALSGGRFHVSVGGGGGLILHDGGIVPGPRGQEVAAILQAGEGVIPLDQMSKLASGRAIGAAAGIGGGGATVNVFIDRPIVANAAEFERMVTSATQRAVRTGGLHMKAGGQRVTV